MKPSIKLIILALSVMFFYTGCSRKKDTFISRNYHALTTKDNILYNGYIALNKGKTAINNAYSENFWQLLPVERMQIEDELRLGDEAKNPDIQIAEDKAAKAINKHSMNINGKEKNPQMDEAYLLLGKARYYDQRFVPALGAFNYILNKYPSSDKINLVKIWREKTNMRLDNNQGAIKNLTKLLNTEEDLEDSYRVEASAALAQAYLKLNIKDSAVMHLDSALAYTKIKENKARYHFIKGQLYNEFGEKDSANLEFDAIIDMHRKIPRAYYINAHLQKSFNFNTEEGDTDAFLEYLTDLEEDRENRPFLDKIYYRIAEFHRSQQADSLAELYYNKSLTKTTTDNELKARNYQTLGNMYFDKNRYKTAGAYYDSTLTALPPKSKAFRVLEKKRRSLDDVIYYEDLAKQNDSILRIAALSKEKQLAFFTEYTNTLKQKAIEAEEKRLEEEKKQQEKANIAKVQTSAAPNTLSPRGIGDVTNPTPGNFYFYNNTTVAYGKNEFLRIWGNRKLQDNWRFSKQADITTVNSQTESTVASIENDPSFNPQTYIDKIPTKQSDLDSISKERNLAYYQLGGIYKNKFNKLYLAKHKYETLLENQPEQRLILPSKYNLYKIYTELDETANANAIKTDIITNYPNTRYADILRNPNSQLTKNENDPEVVYNKLFKQYENQEYDAVIKSTESQILKFEGDPIVPKLEMLNAAAKGRLYGFKAYKESVTYVAFNYPTSDEGKKAAILLNESIPVLAKNEFIEDDKAKHFNVIYEFTNSTTEEINTFVKTLNEELERIKVFYLKVSKDVYIQNTTFVVVHGFESMSLAKNFSQFFENKKDEDGNIITPKITMPYLAISSPNYAIIQRHKNLNNYINPQ